MTSGVNTRSVALDILEEILDNGKYSHMVLSMALSKYQYLEKSERSFISRLVNGTIENKLYLTYVIDLFSKTKCSKMKPIIRDIMLLSTYQILFMEKIPDSAACNEAVKLVNKRGLSGLKGFVNGVLRNIARNKDISLTDLPREKQIEIKYSLPQWIVNMWLEKYDIDTVESIARAFLNNKKTYIRCVKGQQEEITRLLKERNITVKKAPYIDYALEIMDYNYLGEIEEFNEGKIFIQDVSSMLVGEIASVKKNDIVIDVCSAPGGKATHIASLLEGTGHVYARDLSEYKVSLLNENIDRLGITNMSAVAYDATVLDESAIETADVLICDLPCSGLGVIGRKPDIKYNMTRENLLELQKLQRQILSVVSKYVKKGGRMIFSTCTIDSLENEENARYILENLPFEAENIKDRIDKSLHKFMENDYSVQLLPGLCETDGFYISSFIKK